MPDTGPDFSHIPTAVRRLAGERSDLKKKLPKIYINIALLPENLNNIVELVMTAHKSGADIVNFERSFPWSEELKAWEKENFKKIKELSKDLGIKIILPPDHLTPCNLVKLTIFVRVNGDVIPCCYHTDHVIGNLFNDSMIKILKSRAKFIKNISSDPVCSNCKI